MGRHVQRVVGPRLHHEIEPRRWIEDLAVRVAQERLTPRHVGVPHRPGPGRDAADQRLHLDHPLQVEVAVVEDLATEEVPEQQQDHRAHRAQGSQVPPPHRNLSLRAANALIRRSSHPWRNREMLVVPYCRSWYRIATSTILKLRRAAPKRRSKSPKGSKSPKKE